MSDFACLSDKSVLDNSNGLFRLSVSWLLSIDGVSNCLDDTVRVFLKCWEVCSCDVFVEMDLEGMKADGGSSTCFWDGGEECSKGFSSSSCRDVADECRESSLVDIPWRGSWMKAPSSDSWLRSLKGPCFFSDDIPMWSPVDCPPGWS